MRNEIISDPKNIHHFFSYPRIASIRFSSDFLVRRTKLGRGVSAKVPTNIPHVIATIADIIKRPIMYTAYRVHMPDAIISIKKSTFLATTSKVA